MNLFNEIALDSYQAEAIARGLFAIAHADGMHEREEALVSAFWAESGGSDAAFSELSRREAISSEDLCRALSTPDLRRLFVKSAMLLTLADGTVSEKERALLHSYAEELALKDELPALETQVKEFLLSHLSHIQNVDAVADVARKLAI